MPHKKVFAIRVEMAQAGDNPEPFFAVPNASRERHPDGCTVGGRATNEAVFEHGFAIKRVSQPSLARLMYHIQGKMKLRRT